MASGLRKAYQFLHAAGLEDAATSVVPVGHKHDIATASWLEIAMRPVLRSQNECDSLKLV
jgi:hypothetical protein